MTSYLDYSHNMVSVPPLQDFLAVKILKEKGIIPENSVFLPGHGIFRKNHFIKDFVREHASDRENCLKADVVKAIINKHFNFWNVNGHDNLLSDRISEIIESLPFNNLDSSRKVLDFFNISERQAKFIVNSVRIYEYFGFEWRLPLFDKELIDFYLKTPADQKYHKEILKVWYGKNFPYLNQIPCTTYSNFRKPIHYLIHDTLIKQFSSFFCNTKKVRCGNFPLDGFYSRLVVKKPDFGELEKLSPVVSIIAGNILNKNKLTYNGNQTAKFLIPFIEHLDDYIQIENL
jgi:asparagine synthase (glutamine-hydrolysing)